jgi:hypothetical protein
MSMLNEPARGVERRMSSGAQIPKTCAYLATIYPQEARRTPETGGRTMLEVV